MPKTRALISKNIADHLRAFEHSLNETMHLGGLLVAELPKASIDARVAPQVGNAALGHVLASLSRMQEARTQAVLSHEVLETVRVGLGLPEVATGDKYNSGIQTEPTLRAVA